MPVKNSLGALRYPEGSFFSTTTGNGWISVSAANIGVTYRGSNTNYFGTGIGIDPGGNVFVPLMPNATGNGNVFRFDANTGVCNYRTTVDGRGPAVGADSSNVFISYTDDRLEAGIPTYNVRSVQYPNNNTSNVNLSATTVDFTGNLTNAFNFPDSYGMRTYANYFVTLNAFGLQDLGRFYVTDANNKHVASGGIGPGSSSNNPIVRPSDFAINTAGNALSAVAIVNYSLGNGLNYGLTCSSISNITTTTIWRKQISNITFDTNNYYFTAVDNDHVFLSTSLGISKFEISSGNLVAQKGPHPGQAMLVPDDTGNVFAVGGTSITKFDSNLEVVWNNYFNINLTRNTGTGLVGAKYSNNYIYGSIIYGTRLLTFKVPADGTIPGKGIYKVGPYIVKYLQGNIAQTGNTSINFSNVNIISAGWIPAANTTATGTSQSMSIPPTIYSKEI
jgi:hypothetical protein